MSRLLAVDVGNTNISFGLFEDETLVGHGRLASRSVADLASFWSGSSLGNARPAPDVALLASVSPATEAGVSRWIEDGLRIPVRKARVDFDVPLGTDVADPRAVGVDRLLAAFAAWRRAGGAAIAVTVGTAITVNAVTADGRFLGGAIGPGLGLSAEALARGCAQLPHVRLAGPTPVIGKDTEAAIRAALYHGFLGFVERLVTETARELGGGAAVYATGGDAELMLPAVEGMVHAPYLVLEGLLHAWKASGG